MQRTFWLDVGHNSCLNKKYRMHGQVDVDHELMWPARNVNVVSNVKYLFIQIWGTPCQPLGCQHNVFYKKFICKGNPSILRKEGRKKRIFFLNMACF